MLKRHIGEYNFIADSKTGITLRWGTSFAENPIWAPVPELADISISNHCSKGCSFCYKDSKPNNEFMSLEDYCFVLDQMNHPEYGNVFQVALGGGEPLEHPSFKDIIDATYKRSIVPNFTTNGICLSTELCNFIKDKVGAVALSISAIQELQNDKIQMLVNCGIKANIHYVLSEKNISEASDILCGKYNKLFNGINALVFLTYKPVGRASAKDIIKDGSKFRKFLLLVDDKSLIRPRIGFDACFVPMLLKYTNVKKEFIDVCEGAFFSVYIDHKLNVSPCSFSTGKDSYNLHDFCFYDIWNNKFKNYRNRLTNHCENICELKKLCRGGCPYYPEITICNEIKY